MTACGYGQCKLHHASESPIALTPPLPPPPPPHTHTQSSVPCISSTPAAARYCCTPAPPSPGTCGATSTSSLRSPHVMVQSKGSISTLAFRRRALSVHASRSRARPYGGRHQCSRHIHERACRAGGGGGGGGVRRGRRLAAVGLLWVDGWAVVQAGRQAGRLCVTQPRQGEQAPMLLLLLLPSGCTPPSRPHQPKMLLHL